MPLRDGDAAHVGRRPFLAALGSAALAGCFDSAPQESTTTPVPDGYDHPTPTADPDWEVPTDSPVAADVEVEPLVENLEIPWDIAFSGTGELFLTERTGRVLRFDSGEVSEVARPTDAIDAGALEPGSDEEPWWVDGGEGGTLGCAVHPDYPAEPWVYVYYTLEEGVKNQVVRYDVTADQPGETEEVVVDDIPADDRIHNGGRIQFGPDDRLWITTGDANAPERVQEPDFLGGKVLRVDAEGRGLASNPDLGPDRRVFTTGHRNPQGLAWLPSGVPLLSEHGPNARDEIQILAPGDNYGWPDVRGFPGDEDYGSYVDHDDVHPPLVNIGAANSWAPTGATFYTGDGLSQWTNRLLIGGLRSQSIWVVTLTPPGENLPPLDGDSERFDADWLDGPYVATAHRLLHDDIGRVRNVAQSPDGDLYAITSNRDGRAVGRFPREKDDVLIRISAE